MNLDTVVLGHIWFDQLARLGKVIELRLKYKKHRSYVVYVVPYTTIVAVFLNARLVCWGLISIGAVRYVDGASTEPHILSHICQTVPATHILIITNQDKDTAHISWVEHFIHNTLFRSRTNATLRHAANWRREARHKFVEQALVSPTKPTLFVWGDRSVSSKESNSALLKATMEKSRQWWLQLLQ